MYYLNQRNWDRNSHDSEENKLSIAQVRDSGLHP